MIIIIIYSHRFMILLFFQFLNTGNVPENYCKLLLSDFRFSMKFFLFCFMIGYYDMVFILGCFFPLCISSMIFQSISFFCVTDLLVNQCESEKNREQKKQEQI